MIKKLVQLLIFAGYWLCTVPWLVIMLRRHKIINPIQWMDYFIQYTTLLFVLILVYWLINRLVEHCYMKHEVKKRVRKITIKRQLERLERGEIDIEEAQRLSTFTRPDKPKSKRSTSSGRRMKPTEMKTFDANKKRGGPKTSVKINESAKDSSVKVKNRAPQEPTVSTDLPPVTSVQAISDLPPYTDDMVLLERECE